MFAVFRWPALPFAVSGSPVLRFRGMNRRTLALSATIAAIGLVAQSRGAAPSSLNDPLLDRLIGAWVLRGEIAGRQVTHSVEAQWVLAHEYVQIRETSRSK